MNKLAIVVLNWNGADIIEKCIDSLSRQTFDNFQIVVVDNSSEDTSKDILEKQQKILKDKIHIIYNKENSGFAGGVNIGIKYSIHNNFDGVALFNNDAMADKNWLSSLVKILDSREDAGIATGLLLHQNGKTIDSTGDWYTKWGLPTPLYRNKRSSEAPGPSYVFGASGGASLYRIKIFEDIGLFDETFFAYYEDVDISFRAQLAGWKVYYTNDAVAYHEQGGTSKKIPGFTTYKTFKNLPLLFVKNVPRGLLFKIGIRFFIAYWLIFFNTIKNRSVAYAIKGWLASIYFLPGAVVKRFSIQKNKRVSTEYINSIIYQDLPPLQRGIRKFRSIFIGEDK